MFKSIAKWFQKRKEDKIVKELLRSREDPIFLDSTDATNKVIVVDSRYASKYLHEKDYVTTIEYFEKWLKSNVKYEELKRDNENWYTISNRMDGDHASDWLPKIWTKGISQNVVYGSIKVTIYSSNYLLISKWGDEFNPIYEDNKLYNLQTCLLKIAGSNKFHYDRYVCKLARELVNDGYVFIKCRNYGLITSQHQYMVSIDSLSDSFKYFGIEDNGYHTKFVHDTKNSLDLVIDYIYEHHKENIIKIPRRSVFKLSEENFEDQTIEFDAESLKTEYNCFLMKRVDETIGNVWTCDKELGQKIFNYCNSSKVYPDLSFPNILY